MSYSSAHHARHGTIPSRRPVLLACAGLIAFACFQVILLPITLAAWIVIPGLGFTGAFAISTAISASLAIGGCLRFWFRVNAQ